ncbi:pro-neuropeptide Y-like [Bacillus rossius redtenbacheri]|uniref:pro-neuropeptide Y-like n=1 Tax=Bacillus rossius redtenbacheri TaxID=93214 RepID=UPI002FDD67C2
MQCIVSVLVMAALCAVLGLSKPCCCEPMPNGPENMARPARPKTFATPEELRTYLEAVSNYYAIAGRPRFGKRLSLPAYRPGVLKHLGAGAVLPLAAAPDTSLRLQAAPRSPDLYDLLAQYDD